MGYFVLKPVGVDRDLEEIYPIFLSREINIYNFVNFEICQNILSFRQIILSKYETISEEVENSGFLLSFSSTVPFTWTCRQLDLFLAYQKN